MMKIPNFPFLLTLLAALCRGSDAAQEVRPELDRAFGRLYNFDFASAHSIIDQFIAANPADPLGYSVKSSAYLFGELDRLGILEGEFFTDDKKIADKKRLKPDPQVREKLFRAVEDAQSRARTVLDANSENQNALFAMCITYGIVTDYMALVEKKQIGSLNYVKNSTGFAQRLLKINPKFYDAYLTTGLTEYLIGSLPFFVRWFVRIDDIQGNKAQGIQNVELVSRSGHYLKPFARILLSIAYLREKRPRDAKRELTDLVRDFPENPLLRKELEKVSALVARSK
jgi:hypothetical protein